MKQMKFQKYYNVLKALINGCKLLEKNKCKFIVMPCNTAHYWYDDLRKKVNIKKRLSAIISGIMFGGGVHSQVM